MGPNPATAGGVLHLTVREPAEVSLFDLLGRRVGVWHPGTPGRLTLTVPDVATGVYVLQATSATETMAQRIVVR